MADIQNPTGIAENSEVASLQVKFLENIVNPLLTLVLVAVFILFIAGGVRFLIFKETNPEESKKGKVHLLAGGVGLFIVASMWGIINMLGTYTGSSLWFVN
jgi:hypothetical protein